MVGFFAHLPIFSQ